MIGGKYNLYFPLFFLFYNSVTKGIVMTNQQDPKMRFNLLLQHLDLTDDVHMPFFRRS